MKQCEKCKNQVAGDCLQQRVVLRKKADGSLVCHPGCSFVFYEEAVEEIVTPVEEPIKSATAVVKFTDETAQVVESLKPKTVVEPPKKTTPQKGRPPKTTKKG